MEPQEEKQQQSNAPVAACECAPEPCENCKCEDAPVATVPPPWQQRFANEYYETKNRRDKLHNMLIKLRAGTLDFTPQCPASLLCQQERVMNEYLDILEERAEIEGVYLQH